MSFHLINKLDRIIERERSVIRWSKHFYYALCVCLLLFAGLVPAIIFFVVGGLVSAVYWLRQAAKEVNEDNERLHRRD